MINLSEVCIGLFNVSICLYVFFNIINFLWLKWFDGNIYKYSQRIEEDYLPKYVPFEFSKKGITYKVFIENNSMKNSAVPYCANQTVIFINDKPVASLLRIEGIFCEKRILHCNPSYEWRQISKILKWARKEHWNQFLKEYKSKHESNKLIK